MENNIQPNVQPDNYSGNNQITPPHPKTNPLTIVFLVFLILLIAAGSFVLGKYFAENKSEPSLPPTPIVQQPTVIPTTDPTADWKTYTNNGFYKYSLKAPVSAYVHFCSTFADGGYCTGSDEEGYSGIYLKKTDFPYGLIIEQTTLSDADAKITFKKDYSNSTKSDIIFTDPNAVMTKGQEKTEVNGITKNYFYTKYIIRNNNYLYLISIRSKDGKENYDLFNQILSTFRFLDNTQTTDATGTENWKTYTSSNQNYVPNTFFQKFPNFKNDIPAKLTFKYPRTWGIFKIDSIPYNKTILMFSLHKDDPRYSNCRSDGPCENFADMQFRIGMTDSTIKDFDSEFWGQGYPIAKTINSSINGVKVVQVFNTKTSPFPVGTLYKIASDAQVNITSEFFNFKDKNNETDYSKQTIQEFHQILSTFKFIE